MILETANIITLISSDYLSQLGLKAVKLPVTAVLNFGGDRITEFAKATEMHLGSVKFGNGSELLVVPAEKFGRSTATPPIVGEFGLNTFASVDFELDFAQHKLNLYSQDHCPGAVVYWTDNFSSAKIERGPMGNFYFPIELEGKKIQTTLSTTSNENSLGTDVTRSLYSFDEKSPDIETNTNAAGDKRSFYRAITLTGNGLKISNARIGLRTSKNKDCILVAPFRSSPAVYSGCMGGEAPLRLGMNVASHLHLYFATKEHVLYFSDANASKQAAPSP